MYILNRDAAANLTISSPLEAHKLAPTVALSSFLWLRTLNGPKSSIFRHCPPRVATSLCILKSGFLFAASELGNQ